MGTRQTDLQAQTYAERERLAALLAELTPAQWDAPSLCAGWRVREVVAHLTFPFRTKPLRFVAGLAAARFNFSRYADTAARRDASRMSADELLRSLRDNVRHPWQPPGGGQVGALSHDVIHGLDITEPLGLPAAPPERVATVLANADANPRALAYFGVDLTGLTLRATDADIAFGTGDDVLALPAKDLLLTITGRRPLPAPSR
ncbi:maleylpyruvate isomerase family mycothiol-dependent enzyme [Streptacidiphilus neutrinimicus]|uniref:maleylpyruvate isomerase family mycothiol-dependent enzyme n=1 Tax=Streptacidiphilus neutrinimicus TaxID=105420 RepID=UPI0005A82E39|nr:maleylpyruvate isomerase family mycothiol-dependent enzyme [Streptacidiphilus neutrinimicus]